MTSDGHLYRGAVQDFFINRDGDLTGLLLKEAKRFRYSKLEADRATNKDQPVETYWKEIPGANLYVSYEKVVTMNIRYEIPPGKLTEQLAQTLRSMGIEDAIVQMKDDVRLKLSEEPAKPDRT